MGPNVLASSDIDLVERIQNGQVEPEAILYERYSAKVYYVALRGSRSPADAEDVRAETFLRVLQAIRGKQVRSAASLPGFILGVTRNVLNELYARRRHGAASVAPEAADLTAPSHERWFLDQEVRLAVQESIDRLKPRDRTVLRMHFFEESPTAEIARRAGISPERVRLVKSRALKRFREVYGALARRPRKNS
jgi:RNA polymerase sigma-70 factor (ECF subfamily)